MKTLTSHVLVALLSSALMATGLLAGGLALSQDDAGDEVDLSHPQPSPAEMQKQAQKWMATFQPGKYHRLFERFLGKWETSTTIFMAGPNAPGMTSQGTAEYSWLVPGKWLKSEGAGFMMGQPVQYFSFLGYDIYKHKYVGCQLDSLGTNLLTYEGNLGPRGRELRLWGTMDEPMNDEHDKMVRYHYKFIDKDKIVMEVHDLVIGGANTKVVEVVYTRQKATPR